MNDFDDEPYDDGYGEDEGDQLVAEDWPTVHTPVPVWVMLAGLSAKAFLMYCFLAEHINARIQNPNRRIACPKQRAIAKVLGLADDRQVAPYRKELEALGAIRTEKYRYAGGMRQGYKYFVRYNPPAGYQGQMRLRDFYNAHPEFRAAAKWEGRTEAAKKTAAATVPAQAKPATAPKPAPARAARKKAAEVPLAPEVLKVLEAFRPELREAMRETAHTDAPKTLVTAVTKALKERTAEQLVTRVLRRWTTHGYAEKFEAGRLERPVGAAVAMLRHGECPDAGCEDGVLLATDEPCVLCIERGKNYKADYKKARESKKAAAAAAAARLLCPGCEQDRGTQGALCPLCVDRFERDIAEAAERAAEDVARMKNAPAEWADAKARVLAEAEQARERVRQEGADVLGQLLSAQFAARSAATDIHRLWLATLDAGHDRPQESAPETEAATGVPSMPVMGGAEPGPCSGVRWDGSPCSRTTEAEDGLCGICRGAQMAKQEDLAPSY
ncbi:helix-turn-helix domain-containing protein [Streptomyces misionensis]|uniref:helix-turn-helix domain-containing protein n=1 Tax=Streptomyces misionensis TaxID=67331 RepID=UPI0033C942D9